MLTKDRVLADWMEYVGAYFPNTVFGTKCRSWYKKGLEGELETLPSFLWSSGINSRACSPLISTFPDAEGPVIALWPGSCLHAIETLRHPRWEDFDYTSAGPQRNRFSWVGNGWSPVEAAGGDTVRQSSLSSSPPRRLTPLDYLHTGLLSR